MGLFDETVVKAKEVLDIAGKKTNDIISVQKMKMNLATLKSQLSKMYEALGRCCCENGMSAPTANMLEMMTEIGNKEAEYKVLEDKISAVKGDRMCSSCGTKNVSNADFCYRCGTKFASDEECDEAVCEASSEPQEQENAD